MLTWRTDLALEAAQLWRESAGEAAQLPGVESATVSFMTQKMVVEAPDEGFDALMKQVVKACRKIEPDCEIYL